MIGIPYSDTEVIILDDSDPDLWIVRIVDYAARAIDAFEVDGFGAVASGYYDRINRALWLVADGGIFVVKRSDEDVYEVDLPEESFFVYALVSDGKALYVGGEYSNLWRFVFGTMSWEALLRPQPKPPSVDDPVEQTRQVKEYARKYPPYYHGFHAGDGIVFCGALGAVARVRGMSVETVEIDTGARLVMGREEGKRFSLSADSAAGEIYFGDMDEGFELLFSDTQSAMNLTATLQGTRYIGIAEQPSCDLHNLYTLLDGEIAEHTTGCAREPFALSSLISTGGAVWAIDAAGVFRSAGGTWSLVDFDDLEQNAFPAG